MKAVDVLKEFDGRKVKGFQLSKRRGIISTTWLIYQELEFFYFFDINQKIEFIEKHKYSKEEFLEEFKNSYFEIDCVIS